MNAPSSRARQRPLPSRETPAALQSTTRPDRAGLEADSVPHYTQPLLRRAARGAQGGQRLLLPLIFMAEDQGESG